MKKKLSPIIIGLVLALLLTLGISSAVLAAGPNSDGNCHSWGESSEGAGPGLQNMWGKNAH